MTRRIEAPAASPIADGWDRTTTIALGLLGFAVSVAGYARLVPSILDFATYDFWFESDSPAVFSQLTTLAGARAEDRNAFHPLFSSLLVPTRLLSWLLAGNAEAAVGVVVGAVAGLSIGVFFLALRTLGLKRIDAAVFALLLMTSASWIFFASIPETYVFGAFALIVIFALAAWTDHGGHPSQFVSALVVAMTVGVSVSLGVVGLAWLVSFFPRRKVLSIGAMSLGLIGIVGLMQRLLLQAPFPFVALLRPSVGQFAQTFVSPARSDLGAKASALFAHSIVMPPVSVRSDLLLSVQTASIANHSWLNQAELAGWASLLICGIGVAVWRRSRTSVVLLIAFVSQVALYLNFGIETFMYSLHVVPLAIALAAIGATTSNRIWMMPTAAAVALLAGWHNIQAFEDAANRLAERNAAEHAFFAAVERTTKPDDLLIYGAYGYPAASVDTSALVTSQLAPESLSGRARVSIARRGFFLRPRFWSADVVDQLATRGATHFVTAFVGGLDENPQFAGFLQQKHQLVERTTDWAIFRLIDKGGRGVPDAKGIR